MKPASIRQWLELELTESVLMKRARIRGAILRKLRENGVKVAIDDFGTGYSSLSYLRKFPVNALKIDQSFISQIGADAPIVTAVIRMAHSLRLRVIAEGVETLAQLAFLRAQDCEPGTGVLPLPTTSRARVRCLAGIWPLNAGAGAWLTPAAC